MNPTSQQVAKLALAAAAGLTILGVAAFAVTGFDSPTALIPASFGALFGLLGLTVHRTPEDRQSVAGIAVVAAVGVVGSTAAMPAKVSILRGEAVESPVAVASQLVMFAVSVVLLAASAWWLWSERG